MGGYRRCTGPRITSRHVYHLRNEFPMCIAFVSKDDLSCYLPFRFVNARTQ